MLTEIDEYQHRARRFQLLCYLGDLSILLFVYAPFGLAVVLSETQQRLAHFKAGCG